MEKISESQLDLLESKIRAGDLDSVKSELEKYRYEEIPRPLIVKFANLARRVGHHRFAISVLADIVRPRQPLHPAANNSEKTEYAVNLLRIGIVPEALNILNSLDSSANPEVLLYKAFCYFDNWDFALALPLLQSYCNRPELSAYQKLVGQMNLATCYINEMQTSAAIEILSQILKNADPSQNKLMVGAAHQMYAELLVNVNDIAKARDHLRQSKELLQGAHYRYQIYNDQWNAIADLIGSSGSPSALMNLRKVKAIATQKKMWEVVRACDLYEALQTLNDELFLKIYFGTPYPEFRRRILKMYKKPIEIPEYYDWKLTDKIEDENNYFDIHDGKDSKSRAKLNEGKLIHKLLQLFTSDFYRPFKVEAVFSYVYPQEIYNFESSPHKIYDAMTRTRDWLQSHEIPLEIVSNSRGEFHLKASAPYFVRVKAERSISASSDFMLFKLKAAFAHTWFRRADATKILGSSEATVGRFLKSALDNKKLTSQGKGRATKYKIAP
jgi:hypothetical protein